jgi:hypothetical protein
MPLTKQFCKRQIERMEGLPYYASIGVNGFQELVNALQEAAVTEQIARGAVDAILADTCRAANPETNRVPSPGELRVWVEAQSPAPLDDTRPARRFCGYCESGWVRSTTEYRGMPYALVGRCVCQGGTFIASPREGMVTQ